MAAQLEIELHAHLRAWTGAIEADGVARATRRRRPVQRPGDALEDRRLAGAVRPDDTR